MLKFLPERVKNIRMYWVICWEGIGKHYVDLSLSNHFAAIHYKTKRHFPIRMLILSYQYLCLMTSTSGWMREQLYKTIQEGIAVLHCLCKHTCSSLHQWIYMPYRLYKLAPCYDCHMGTRCTVQYSWATNFPYLPLPCPKSR